MSDGMFLETETAFELFGYGWDQWLGSVDYVSSVIVIQWCSGRLDPFEFSIFLHNETFIVHKCGNFPLSPP